VGTRTLISAVTLPATGTRTPITSATSALTAPPTGTRLAPVAAPVVAAVAAAAVLQARPPKSPKSPKSLKPKKVPRKLRVKAPRQPRVQRAPRVKPARRRWRRAKAQAPAPHPLSPPTPNKRRWRARHVMAVLSAPLVLIAGGGFAYFWLARPESIEVPNVVHRDVFTAASTLKKAGFEVDSIVTDNPRPAGVVLAQTPRRGLKADEGSTVTITISDKVATVPEVVGTPVDDALAALRHVGFVNLPVVDDYRSDVEPGTVVSVTPPAFSDASKTDPVSVSVARDPHVTVPNVVGTDQATATGSLQQLGLVVAVKSGSSGTVPAGNVISASPGADRVLVRGATVTLTVSTGPKLVKVPYVVGSSSDDARSELEDAGFAVAIATTPVANSQVGDVVAENPAGGQAPEGSTVTITVGARQNGR
jgi:serine/threonine-protein kinase